jgi:hypothetical protein
MSQVPRRPSALPPLPSTRLARSGGLFRRDFFSQANSTREQVGLVGRRDDGARDWRQELIDSVPANRKQPNLVAALRRTAEVEYQAKDCRAAIGKLTSAIANGADDGLVWLRLAQSELAANDDHAMASAYNAYLKSTDSVERGAALFVIGRDYDRHDKQKEALAAFDAGLGLTHLSAIADRAEELRRLVAFRITKVEVQAEADEARACLRFNEQIAAKADISYGAFVRSEPKLDGIVTAHGDTLCLDGLKHGAIYNVEVLSGLPATTGERLREKFSTGIGVPAPSPSRLFLIRDFVANAPCLRNATPPKAGTLGKGRGPLSPSACSWPALPAPIMVDTGSPPALSETGEG